MRDTPILTPAQRLQLKERHFVDSDVLFDASQIDEVRRECMRVREEALKDPHNADVPANRLRPFLPSLHRTSPVVAAFLRHPVFVALARDLIGPDVDQVWNQACLKFPDDNGVTEFPYHQDWQFQQIDDVTPNFSCFIALSHLNEENGTLYFAAGGAMRRLPHVRNEALGWWECSVDGLEVHPSVLQPGQMTVYSVLTPHGSPPNRTSAAREAFLVSFGVPGLTMTNGEPFGDQRPLLRGGVLVPE